MNEQNRKKEILKYREEIKNIQEKNEEFVKHMEKLKNLLEEKGDQATEVSKIGELTAQYFKKTENDIKELREQIQETKDGLQVIYHKFLEYEELMDKKSRDANKLINSHDIVELRELVLKIYQLVKDKKTVATNDLTFQDLKTIPERDKNNKENNRTPSLGSFHPNTQGEQVRSNFQIAKFSSYCQDSTMPQGSMTLKEPEIKVDDKVDKNKEEPSNLPWPFSRKK